MVMFYDSCCWLEAVYTSAKVHEIVQTMRPASTMAAWAASVNNFGASLQKALCCCVVQYLWLF